MEISLESKVYLKHSFHTGTGNYYPARKEGYYLYEIPEKYRTEKYLIPAENATVTVEKAPDIGLKQVEINPYETASGNSGVVKKFEQEVVKINEAESADPITFAKNEEVVLPKKLCINTATAEEIAVLDGVSLEKATKVVELRQEKQFGDCNDLDARVKLAFGRKWQTYNDKICF